MKHQKNVRVVICPPCGEQSLAPEGFNPGVAVATKEGQNWKKSLWPLLPHLSAVLPPQGREMPYGFTARSVIPQYRYVGYNRRTGFTLIELLVVVLIIGILAAVAVPQYKFAVEKARALQAIIYIKSLANAYEVYYLQHGMYPTHKSNPSIDEINDELDISVNEVDGFKIDNMGKNFISMKRPVSGNPSYAIVYFPKHSNYPPWNEQGMVCRIYATRDENQFTARICKKLCNTSTLKKIDGGGNIGCELP